MYSSHDSIPSQILEYHPQILQKYVHTADRRNLVYTRWGILVLVL